MAELPLEGDLEAPTYAASRLWRAINGRAPGPAPHQLSKNRRERLSAAIRALDAHSVGGSYRVIGEALSRAQGRLAQPPRVPKIVPPTFGIPLRSLAPP
ncbi:DUF2285 domain-containing protein [Bradyrhizobium sp. SUTN9-2]|uniref:DNA -binding domain-containing protein n=1 Tax=Bradyrhizobium sp. SUTN9-2 TaxID=1167456 RepID=UPI001FCECDE7|nr:DUF2285 domain-containing protein [Bradyrhizobium sp. SUTN9-2]